MYVKRHEQRCGAAYRGPHASIQPEVFVAATQTAKNPAMPYRVVSRALN
jgi:hypothetical protein